MAKEIEILLDAQEQGYLVVAKDSNVLWVRDELLHAQAGGLYREAGFLEPVTEATAVSGRFPGCLQQGSATEQDRAYLALGQTEHFVIFSSDGDR